MPKENNHKTNYKRKKKSSKERMTTTNKCMTIIYESQTTYSCNKLYQSYGTRKIQPWATAYYSDSRHDNDDDEDD